MLLVIGYPIAYGIARTPRRLQAVLVVLVVLPFWTSFLIRIYAWMNILQRDGPLNQLLLALHIVRAPPVWLATDTAIYIGIVYSYLPFMVLPLYAVLEKLDESLLEAAADLGCPRWKTFWLVTLPLSSPGVLAGVLLCFIPIVGEFVIPDLLGGSRSADDRADDLDGVLRQQGLADRRRRSPSCWSASWSRRSWSFSIRRCAPRSGADACARSRSFNLARPRARHRLPLPADRDAGDLFVQRLAPGHGVGRLVDALVRRACRRRRDPRCGLHQPARRIRFRLRGDGAGHAGGAGARSLRPLPRPAPVRLDDLCAAGHAGSDHRIVDCCFCSSRSRSIAAFGPWPSPTRRWRCASSP